MKTCSHCKKDFDLSDFVIDKGSRDGRGYVCKSCRSKRDKRYREEKADFIKQSKKRYLEENREEINKRARENSRKPERIKKKREYREKNKEEFAIYIYNYRVENADRIKETVKKYQKNRSSKDYRFKLANNLRHRLYMALKSGDKTGSHVSDLGCTVEYLSSYLESKFYPHPITGQDMSWDNYGQGMNKWQIDHVEALCLFDLTNRDELLRACHYTNLRPLWHEDHIKKTEQDIKKSKQIKSKSCSE